MGKLENQDILTNFSHLNNDKIGVSILEDNKYEVGTRCFSSLSDFANAVCSEGYEFEGMSESEIYLGKNVNDGIASEYRFYTLQVSRFEVEYSDSILSDIAGY